MIAALRFTYITEHSPLPILEILHATRFDLCPEDPNIEYLKHAIGGLS
jgi:hypothetical protein